MARLTLSRRHWLLGAAGVAGAALLVKRDAIFSLGTPHSGPRATGGGVDDLERKYAQQRADLCGGGNAVGVGLRGEYFVDDDLSGATLLTRTDRFVDFDATLDWPADQANRPRSVRWSGWIKPPLAGAYRFHADTPGFSISVANRQVAGPGAATDAAVDMALGRFYPITLTLRHVDPAFQGRWRLEWTAPHGMRYVVPTALLFPPTNPVR